MEGRAADDRQAGYDERQERQLRGVAEERRATARAVPREEHERAQGDGDERAAPEKTRVAEEAETPAASQAHDQSAGQSGTGGARQVRQFPLDDAAGIEEGKGRHAAVATRCSS